MYAGSMMQQKFPIGHMIERRSEDNYRAHIITKELHDSVEWIYFENKRLDQTVFPSTVAHKGEKKLYCQWRKKDEKTLEQMAR